LQLSGVYSGGANGAEALLEILLPIFSLKMLMLLYRSPCNKQSNFDRDMSSFCKAYEVWETKFSNNSLKKLNFLNL